MFGVLLADLFKEAGFPPGVMNVVHGDGEVGQQLAESDINILSFTGSLPVARKLGAIAGGRGISMLGEMGGSAPSVLLEGVTVTDELLRAITAESVANSGQFCERSARVIAHYESYEEVVVGLIDLFSARRLGNANDPKTEVGPLISNDHTQRVHALVRRTLQQSGRLLTGGKRREGMRPNFYEPTVIANGSIGDVEIFGPVITVEPFAAEKEAIAAANYTKYGLAAYVRGGDIQQVGRVASKIDAGMVSVNGAGFYSPNTSFGGFGDSGVGLSAHGWQGWARVVKYRTTAIPKAQTV
jgi:acyl-CoA reductase-like NAD-dependent aldehyde dehydrogenase